MAITSMSLLDAKIPLPLFLALYPFILNNTFIPINEINFHTQKPVFKPFFHKKRATPRAALKI